VQWSEGGTWLVIRCPTTGRKMPARENATRKPQGAPDGQGGWYLCTVILTGCRRFLSGIGNTLVVSRERDRDDRGGPVRGT